MRYDGLIELVKGIEPGDLLAMMAVIDEAVRLVDGETEGRGEYELLHHIIGKLSVWMRDGMTDDWDSQLDTMISSLRNLDRRAEPLECAGDEDADYDLVVSFVAESRNHLEDIESRLLSMEDSPDPELVNGVFRSIHTIKGVSSFLGLPRVKSLSHAMETVLDEVRTERRTVDSELIDVLLAGSDLLEAFVEAIDRWAGSVDSLCPGPLTEPDVDTEEVLVRLKSLGDAPKTDDSPPPDRTIPLYTPEMLENFGRESSDLIDDTEKALMDLDDGGGKGSLDEAFRGIHTIKGNAGFFGLSDIEQFCQSLESVMDSMRKDERQAGSGTVTGLLSGLDSLRDLVSRAGEPPSEDPEPSGTARNLGGVLVELGAVQPEDIDAALDIQNRRLGEILIDNGIVDESKVQQALKVQSARSAKSGIGPTGGGKRDVRVDTGRLDTLFTLIGELITAHAMVTNSPDLLAHKLPDFEKAASSMGKIIRDVQTLSLSIRMIPLDGLFSKMRRLTRDLSRKFGKTVDFVSRGEDTEMDRQIIEQISDPLVHIVRNAIDHGLESPGDRKAAGKHPSGLVELSAGYEGNEIWISVKDDGGGLSRKKILSKAAERGIDLGEDGGDSLPDKTVWSLIFEPGFSTAETVSDVSGRGVGMDVVRQNIEKLRGQVSVDSIEGAGTTVTLQIPMTLAIVDGITFRTGGILFALAIADIVEFHRPGEGGITTAPGNRKVLRMRDQLLPIISLEDYYHTVGTAGNGDRTVYIILGSGERKAAVPADEILGNRQLVVKPLPDKLRNVRALAGCSILGNGDVCLILDVGFLVASELDGKRR